LRIPSSVPEVVVVVIVVAVVAAERFENGFSSILILFQLEKGQKRVRF
jgi:hypothetical protein